MKTLCALVLALLSVSTVTSAASQQDDSTHPVLAPPKDDVMIVKASTGSLLAHA
jgi:hypothetical protein